MNYQTVKLEKREHGVTWLWLARAEKHNAMSAAMLDDLTGAVQELSEDDQVRVVVLAGEGKSFCAGGDLDWMRQQFEANREERIAEATKLAHMLRDLNTLPKPVIGRIHGQAFGGGIGLMSICDFAIVASGQKFGLTEARLGLIPATISPYVIARMGEGKARQVFMNGGLFDSHRALALGLASQVVEPEQVDEAVDAAVKPYLSAAPGAVAASKALARSLGPTIDEDVISDTVRRLADTWETDEAQKGIKAFFDKTPPSWAVKS